MVNRSTHILNSFLISMTSAHEYSQEWSTIVHANYNTDKCTIYSAHLCTFKLNFSCKHCIDVQRFAALNNDQLTDWIIKPGKELLYPFTYVLFHSCQRSLCFFFLLFLHRSGLQSSGGDGPGCPSIAALSVIWLFLSRFPLAKLSISSAERAENPVGHD